MQITTKTTSRNNRIVKIARLKISAVQKRELQTLLEIPVVFIPHAYFRRPKLMSKIMQQDIQILPVSTIKAEEERILFLQMNYARGKICQVRRRLLSNTKGFPKEALELLQWHKKQLDARNKITTANMGLVFNMAKHVSHYDMEFNDLISEGSLALLHAVEKFDVSRGFKFSTYACRSILRSFSRITKRQNRYRSIFPVELEFDMEKGDYVEEKRQEKQLALAEEVHAILQRNGADLSPTEKSVVEMRFSLNQKGLAKLTLKQVGEELGLTKERIRQIQNKALLKLREATEQQTAAS